MSSNPMSASAAMIFPIIACIVAQASMAASILSRNTSAGDTVSVNTFPSSSNNGFPSSSNRGTSSPICIRLVSPKPAAKATCWIVCSTFDKGPINALAPCLNKVKKDIIEKNIPSDDIESIVNFHDILLNESPILLKLSNIFLVYFPLA